MTGEVPEPDQGAAQQAYEAAARLYDEAAAELDLLVGDHSALPEVQDFHERYTLVRRSVSHRDRSA